MTTTFLEDGVGDVLSKALHEVDGGVYVVNPVGDSISDIVFRLHDVEDAPNVQLLAPRDPLKEAMEDFIVAGHAADLLSGDGLSIRVLDEEPKASLFVSEDAVVSLVEADGRVGGLTSADEAFATQVRSYYEHRWNESDEFQLRTPPLSRVQESLTGEIGPDIATDFDGILESLSVAKGDGEGLDEVTIAILAAARNGVLLYDVSKWGEDVGLASKATFSRTKSHLEDSGLIDTEKVPIDVGRPRLRLQLGSDALQDADPPELASMAADRLYD